MPAFRSRSASGVAVLFGLVLVAGADERAQAREDEEARCGEIPPLPPPTADWPTVRSEIQRDAVTEALVAAMVSRLTLPQQGGQTAQARTASLAAHACRP